MIVLWRWLWVVVWCASAMCSHDFLGLGLWVWVHGFGFMSLRSWIIDVIGVDCWVDRRGSLTWSVSSAWVIDLIGMGLWLLLWSLELWWLVVGGGYNCWERERERMKKTKNKKWIKNYKEIIFKWGCKKNRSFDVWYVVK